jgi:multiple sugar transport system substrate-binding protein
MRRRTALRGLAAILAAGQGPALAQARRVHWLKWVDFVPETDLLLRNELLPQAEKELGLTIVLETVNGNDLQPRLRGAIRSGSGPDLFMAFNEQPWLVADATVDLADLAATIATRDGAWTAQAAALCSDGRRFMALPWVTIGSLVAWRRSWLAEAGAAAPPTGWESYRALGRALKGRGRPIGQTLGHTFGDAPGFTYPYLWSWGGKEVEADGRTVAINARETLESVRFLQGLWQDAMDPAGLDWDDTGNNRAFLAQRIGATLNGASIYLEARRNPARYRTAAGAPLADEIVHAPLPAGPGGQYGLPLLQSTLLMKYAPDPDTAKVFLSWLHAPANYERFFRSQGGFSTPCTARWESHPAWDLDPALAPFRGAARIGRSPGWPGPPHPGAARSLSRFIVTDMYAKAVRGLSAAEAVAWADAALRNAYAG